MRRPFLLGLVLLLLVGCGDNDGGGTGSSQVFQGTYRGTMTFAVIVGSASRGFSSPMVILVSGNNVQVGQFPAVPLSGNRFATSLPASAFNQPGNGLNCTQGGFGVEGTFVGTRVSGPVASTGLLCNGFPVTITGSYVATLQAAQLPRGGHESDLVETLREAVRRMVP